MHENIALMKDYQTSSKDCKDLYNSFKEHILTTAGNPNVGEEELKLIDVEEFINKHWKTDEVREAAARDKKSDDYGIIFPGPREVTMEEKNNIDWLRHKIMGRWIEISSSVAQSPLDLAASPPGSAGAQTDETLKKDFLIWLS